MSSRKYPRIELQPGMRGCSVQLGCETLHFNDSDEDRKELADLLHGALTDRAATEKAYYEKYRGHKPATAVGEGVHSGEDREPSLANGTVTGQGGSVS